MELFVIRHGIAVPGSMLLADADRPLTPEGRKRFSQAVAGLQRLGVRCDRLYHSPWLRAVGERVALVGHQPWLGELVYWLLMGDQANGSGFAFKRGGVAWLEGRPTPGRMMLRAFLPPKVLRGLGVGRAH